MRNKQLSRKNCHTDTQLISVFFLALPGYLNRINANYSEHIIPNPACLLYLWEGTRENPDKSHNLWLSIDLITNLFTWGLNLSHIKKTQQIIEP